MSSLTVFEILNKQLIDKGFEFPCRHLGLLYPIYIYSFGSNTFLFPSSLIQTTTGVGLCFIDQAIHASMLISLIAIVVCSYLCSSLSFHTITQYVLVSEEEVLYYSRLKNVRGVYDKELGNEGAL